MKEILNKDIDNGYESELGEQDSLSMYLKQIAAYPLLSREEELSIAFTLQTIGEQRLKLREKLQYGEISSAEYSEQLSFFEDDYNSSRNKLITSNLRLVVSIAKKYQHRGLNLVA